MLHPDNTMREGSVRTLSALVENVVEEASMSDQAKSCCEHQHSISVRVVLYMVTILLAAHMITSTILYAYLSINFEKMRKDVEPWNPISNMAGNRTWVNSALFKQCLHQYLVSGTEKRKGDVRQGTFNARKGDQPGGHGVHHSPQRTAAHLIGTTGGNSPPGIKFPRDKGVPIEHWISAGIHAFTHNIVYTSGKLVITESGLYYVYCQVSFRLTSSKSERVSNDPFVQYIYLQTNPNRSIMLMKASNTPVDISQGSSFNSVNQGGVFQLKKGDKLFVSVTTTDLLSYDEDTYFGIFRL
ncbi:CD40 ligand [Narcine bancroftii]|uniref:CD40 ligand n=1 Tax=Narcine bancroftii TaxID=1343680 RepID=UPI0038315915